MVSAFGKKINANNGFSGRDTESGWGKLTNEIDLDLLIGEQGKQDQLKHP